jgi:thioredoxin 1
MATVQVTKDNIEKLVDSDDIVVLDFWASWCGPCRRFAPVFEASSDEHPEVVHGKIDTEQERELAGSLGIQGIPTIMVFRERVLVYREAGALPGPAFNDLIAQVKSLDMDDVRKQMALDET